MTWQTAKQAAENITGRVPRWCDVRDEQDQIAAAPIPEAMSDCIALNAVGRPTSVTHWMNDVPCGADIEAVCYF